MEQILLYTATEAEGLIIMEHLEKINKLQEEIGERIQQIRKSSAYFNMAHESAFNRSKIELLRAGKEVDINENCSPAILPDGKSNIVYDPSTRGMYLAI